MGGFFFVASGMLDSGLESERVGYARDLKVVGIEGVGVEDRPG